MATNQTKSTKLKEETQMLPKAEAALTSEDLYSLQNEFAGSFNVRTELLKIPYLRLTHGTSEAFKAGLSKDGEFSCSLRSKNYGDKVTIIPLYVSESASLLFSPKFPPKNISEEERKNSNNGDVICSSADLFINKNGVPCKNCPYGEYHADWGPKNNSTPPKCKQSIDVICLVDGEDKSVMLNFRKSNYSAGKALVNLIANDSRKIQFGSKYTLTSKIKPSDDGDYWIISEVITQTPLNAEEFNSVIPLARSIVTARRRGEIKVDEHESHAEDLPV